MTAEEAQAVIALWQQERTEQTGLTDRPALPDVAEGLGIGVEDVQRLLEAVREQRAEEERALAYEQELAEIRLAEEERKLAEVRRQRAESQCGQAVGRKSSAVMQAADRSPGLSWQIPVIVITLLLLLWMATGVGSKFSGSSTSSTSGNCVVTMPDGGSQPCGPGYSAAHPEDSKP